MRAVLLAATLVLVSCTADAGEKNSAWIKDYDQARKLARKTGKPMFVVFR